MTLLVAISDRIACEAAAEAVKRLRSARVKISNAIVDVGVAEAMSDTALGAVSGLEDGLDELTLRIEQIEAAVAEFEEDADYGRPGRSERAGMIVAYG